MFLKFCIKNVYFLEFFIIKMEGTYSLLNSLPGISNSNETTIKRKVIPGTYYIAVITFYLKT